MARPPYSVDFINRLMARAGEAGQQAAAGLQAPINTLERLADETAVQMPDAPTPAANPFGSLGTALGMAVTGQGAQYAAGLTQTLQQEAARQDQYRAQKLQALNYEQLRRTNIGLATADAKAKQATAAKAAQDKVFRDVRSDAQFERGAKQTDRQLDQADRRLNQQAGAQGESFDDRYSTYVDRLTNPKNPGTLARYERLMDFTDLLSSDIVVVPETDESGKVTQQQKNRNEMSADEFAAAQAEMVAQIERDMTHLRRLGGDPDVVARFYGDFEAALEGISKTEDTIAEDAAGLNANPTTQRALDESVTSAARPATAEAPKRADDFVEWLNSWLQGDMPPDLEAQLDVDTASNPESMMRDTRRMAEDMKLAQEFRQGFQSGGANWIKEKEGAGRFKGASLGLVDRAVGDVDPTVIGRQSKPGKHLKPLRQQVLAELGVEESQLTVSLINDLNDRIKSEWRRRKSRIATYRGTKF